MPGPALITGRHHYLLRGVADTSPRKAVATPPPWTPSAANAALPATPCRRAHVRTAARRAGHHTRRRALGVRRSHLTSGDTALALHSRPRTRTTTSGTGSGISPYTGRDGSDGGGGVLTIAEVVAELCVPRSTFTTGANSDADRKHSNCLTVTFAFGVADPDSWLCDLEECVR